METTQLINALRPLAATNNFAASLIQNFNRFGSLTPRQISAAVNMVNKPAPVKIDASRIEKLFSDATQSGLKRPKLRLDGVVLSLAGSTSVNAGSIYVKGGSDYESPYYGKIQNGTFVSHHSAPSNLGQKLSELSVDPMGAVVSFGRLTGACACCGRNLTDPTSIERGVGPICAEKWRL